ncbi:hypothetical protein ANN_27849 [Periplaneta americana]|uniref:HTH psq-type domain-containing protein n=1 Tax=Periplaneta americana TaxID=6978 RepID=A0ABQ8RVB9_PERAM|nr:hypothetical protein ANN_27849 [Periplaneta americana]
MTERPLTNAQLVSVVNSSDSEEFVSEFEDNLSYESESENDDDFDSQQPVGLNTLCTMNTCVIYSNLNPDNDDLMRLDSNENQLLKMTLFALELYQVVKCYVLFNDARNCRGYISVAGYWTTNGVNSNIMPRTYTPDPHTKRYKKVDEDKILAASKDVEKGLSFREAARIHGLDHTILYRHFKK